MITRDIIAARSDPTDTTAPAQSCLIDVAVVMRAPRPPTEPKINLA